MRTAEEHFIKEITEILVQPSLSKNDVGQLLTKIRCLIELEKKQDKFKTLFFYCNWMAHPVIDKNKELYSILEVLNIGFAKLPEGKFYTNVVFDGLRVFDLRIDFASFFLEFSLPVINIDVKFLLDIFKNLLLKPIRYPNKLKVKDEKKNATVTKVIDVEKLRENYNPINHNPMIIKSIEIESINDNKVLFVLDTETPGPQFFELHVGISLS
jgi:hypothetical protein